MEATFIWRHATPRVLLPLQEEWLEDLNYQKLMEVRTCQETLLRPTNICYVRAYNLQIIFYFCFVIWNLDILRHAFLALLYNSSGRIHVGIFSVKIGLVVILGLVVESVDLKLVFENLNQSARQNTLLTTMFEGRLNVVVRSTDFKIQGSMLHL